VSAEGSSISSKERMRAPADETSSLYPRRSALSAREFYRRLVSLVNVRDANWTYKAALNRGIVAAQEGLLRKGDSDLLGNRDVGKQHELEKQSSRGLSNSELTTIPLPLHYLLLCVHSANSRPVAHYRST
jgi:hypothetical protein